MNEEEGEETVKLYFVPHVTFSFNFCMQLLFYMFSTLVSLEDRLRLKLKVKTSYNAGLPMAIPIYTVLPYCVIEPWVTHGSDLSQHSRALHDLRQTRHESLWERFT